MLLSSCSRVSCCRVLCCQAGFSLFHPAAVPSLIGFLSWNVLLVLLLLLLPAARASLVVSLLPASAHLSLLQGSSVNANVKAGVNVNVKAGVNVNANVTDTTSPLHDLPTLLCVCVPLAVRPARHGRACVSIVDDSDVANTSRGRAGIPDPRLVAVRPQG